MASITYTFIRRCTGGEHAVFDVSLNGGASRRVVYETDAWLRVPLSALSEDQQELALAFLLRLHMMGKTRAEIVAEFQAGPVTVTI